jgi:hypothetical protein
MHAHWIWDCGVDDMLNMPCTEETLRKAAAVRLVRDLRAADRVEATTYPPELRAASVSLEWSIASIRPRRLYDQ